MGGESDRATGPCAHKGEMLKVTGTSVLIFGTCSLLLASGATAVPATAPYDSEGNLQANFFDAKIVAPTPKRDGAHLKVRYTAPICLLCLIARMVILAIHTATTHIQRTAKRKVLTA